MRTVSPNEATARLSRPWRHLAAREDPLITTGGPSVATSVSVVPKSPVFRIDQGRLGVPHDFDAPLRSDLFPGKLPETSRCLSFRLP